MRCQACNVELTDFEATRKSAETNDFIDLCNDCYAPIKNDLRCVERMDLMHEDDDDFLDTDMFE